MNKLKSKLDRDRLLIRGSIILFILSIGIAYLLYPHWVTFSLLALQFHTLPFFLCAMAVTIFLFAHAGKRLRLQELHIAGVAMYLSAACAGLVVLIPYKAGHDTQIFWHNMAALFFVLFAATGLAWLARTLHDYILGWSALLQVGVCIFELILMARYDQHPVQSWVWVVLQVFVTLLLLLSLLRIFSVLEDRK